VLLHIPNRYSLSGMQLVSIYACLCEPIRLRILRLLAEGPLCVCHLQTILKENQVKVSKHLAYLKTRGLVEVRRKQHWRVYEIKQPTRRVLAANLACLEECVRDEAVFQRDAARLRRLKAHPDGTPACAESAASILPSRS